MPRYTIKIEGNVTVEGSNTSLGVGTNWKSFGGCQFYIEKGSTLIMSSSSLAFRQATFYVEGDKGLVWNGNKKKEPIATAGTAVNFELGMEGSVDFGSSAWVSGAYAVFGATLDLNQVGEAYVATRTLVYGWGTGNLPVATDTYTPYKIGSNLSDVTTEYKDGPLDASTDGVGTWTVSIVGKDLVLSYITKDGLIPEPGTASLGLLGLASLVFRRRRTS